MRQTKYATRERIRELAKAGYTDREIAAMVGWSQETVKKWRRRAEHQGKEGLKSHLGRPAKGALSSFPAEIPRLIRHWRLSHPGWGAKTLRVELERQGTGLNLPSVASLGIWLKQQGLTGHYRHHVALPQTSIQALTQPHQVWQLDARGQEYVPEVGVIGLINIIDVYSRTKIESYPCWLGHQRAEHRPTTEDYQIALRLAFCEWGLPAQLSLDHDSVFIEAHSASPFPTRLHLWALALGVDVHFIRTHRPTDHACVERSHQTWFHQVVQGQRFTSWDDLLTALVTRRSVLNSGLPCSTLGNRPPLVACPAAVSSLRPYRPEWEAELLNLSNVDAYLSHGRWFRTVSSAGTVSLGGSLYYLTPRWAKHELEIHFDPQTHLLHFQSPHHPDPQLLPIQGVSLSHLIGHLGALHHLPSFQLALPFSWEETRFLLFTKFAPPGTTLLASPGVRLN